LFWKKLFWYLLDFKWEAGEWKYCSKEDRPADFYVRDLQGNRCLIRRHEVWEAQETLGIHLAPDGNVNLQAEKLKKLAIERADNMRTGHFTRSEAWLAVTSTIMRTHSYPLAALNLTKSQCEDIMRPILYYALPAMGFCRTFPRDIVFGPKLYLGLGFKHLYTLQETARLNDILYHTHCGPPPVICM